VIKLVVLFDQSRVVQLFNGERSYHIFYELCAGASPILKGNIRNFNTQFLSMATYNIL